MMLSPSKTCFGFCSLWCDLPCTTSSLTAISSDSLPSGCELTPRDCCLEALESRHSTLTLKGSADFCFSPMVPLNAWSVSFLASSADLRRSSSLRRALRSALAFSICSWLPSFLPWSDSATRRVMLLPESDDFYWAMLLSSDTGLASLSGLGPFASATDFFSSALSTAKGAFFEDSLAYLAVKSCFKSRLLLRLFPLGGVLVLLRFLKRALNE